MSELLFFRYCSDISPDNRLIARLFIKTVNHSGEERRLRSIRNTVRVRHISSPIIINFPHIVNGYKELQGVYNDGLQKNKQIDIITAYNLTFKLEESLKRSYYIKHEYTQELDGSYVHYFALMGCDEIKQMGGERNRV